MDTDLLDLYERASAWASSKFGGAAGHLDAATPCDDWDVRMLLNHVLETERYFLSTARGEDGSPPSADPPDILSDDPANDFAEMRTEMITAFSEPGVIDKTGPSLGIASSDQLLHGWDIATATGQDATMPEGLAEAAYGVIHGRFTEDQRKGVFKPELPVDDEATPQDRLLAYTGRGPSDPLFRRG